MAKQQIAVIIGAGPAGLTAALEFCRQSSVHPIVLEASSRIGGISCTIRYKGNRIDIGGHRFFSKSDRVMNWWTDLMPLAAEDGQQDSAIQYRRQTRSISRASASAAPQRDKDADCVMLLRPRRSRIYFNRTFFDYPLSLSPATLKRLGLLNSFQIGLSYLWARLSPRKPEKTLEDFLINRFGRKLYLTFFKSYTEKVWGVPCEQISAAWGAQRIKGLSLRKAIVHFLKGVLSRKKKSNDIRQKGAETSLIEQFLYPKFGPGQLWEHVADLVQQQGGEVRLQWCVVGLQVEHGSDGVERITSVQATSPAGELHTIQGDYFFSTMPIRELLHVIDAKIPADVQAISDGLVYRDFITVGLLVDRLLIQEEDGSPVKDTWIYIQEPDVLLGRLQIFNNWSPYLVADPTKMWIGLEYFCNDTDPLWSMTDEAIARFAIGEVAKIGILNADDVRDSCVFRVPKTYPAYFGTFNRFDEIVRYMDRFENLFLVGRNGMHKYNNQDHSMLTAMVAVENILAGNMDKESLWKINTEEEYHEEKDGAARQSTPSSATEGASPRNDVAA